jgi:hypothetical protein
MKQDTGSRAASLCIARSCCDAWYVADPRQPHPPLPPLHFESRMCFLHKIGPSSAISCVPTVVCLTESLDVAQILVVPNHVAIDAEFWWATSPMQRIKRIPLW